MIYRINSIFNKTLSKYLKIKNALTFRRLIFKSTKEKMKIWHENRKCHFLLFLIIYFIFLQEYFNKLLRECFSEIFNWISEGCSSELEVVICKYHWIFYIRSLLYKVLIYMINSFFNKRLSKALFLEKRVKFEASDFQKY